MTRHVVLVGLMGSGKTSLGRALAAELGRPFRDNDELLGEAPASIQQAEGLDELHAREEEVALRALAHPAPAVIALAASVVESAQVREALEGHLVVWLTADPSILSARRPLEADRPLLDDDPAGRRAALYGAVADLVIDTGGSDITAAAWEIAGRLRSEGGDGPRRGGSRGPA